MSSVILGAIAGADIDKKTVASTNKMFEESIDNINKDITEASEVFNSAKDAYDKGVENNANNPNSGLNMGVAIDKNGNAIGTYDWDAQAENKAKITYNSNVLQARQDATASRQEVVSNQREGQVQHDMAQYAANQSAEKAGWTGGYILDSNRQVAFLKESIKASLYSQEELQKYGFDNALAAARAEYDLNRAQLAADAYNNAVSNALQMASFTGKFISPEASYHLSQFGTAKAILNSGATGEEATKAKAVIEAVDNWFATNGISKEGVYSIAMLLENYNAASTIKNNLTTQLLNTQDAWDNYKLRLDSTQEAVTKKNNEYAANTGVFYYVDSYGNETSMQANFAEAAASKDSYNRITAGLSDIARNEYFAALNSYITSIVTKTVTSKLSGLDFTSEEEAEKYARSELKKALATYGNTDIMLKEMPAIACKINGKDATITLEAQTIAMANEAELIDTPDTTIKAGDTDGDGIIDDETHPNFVGPPRPENSTTTKTMSKEEIRLRMAWGQVSSTGSKEVAARQFLNQYKLSTNGKILLSEADWKKEKDKGTLKHETYTEYINEFINECISLTYKEGN